MKGIIVEILRDHRSFLGINPDEITYKNIRFTVKFNDKFPQDKIFYESEDYIIVFDGFLLDKMQWFKQYNVFTMNKLIEKIFFVSRKSGGSLKSIIENFRGSFSGAFLEKKIGRLTVFNDHLSSRNLYYSVCDDKTTIASHVPWLLNVNDLMAKEFDEITLKSMITHGYSLEDRTLFENVKKIRPGNLLSLDIEQPMVLQFENYYWLDNTENHSITFEDATEELNRLFDQAVNRAFSKDEEYGYEHLVALSGGLDSRMVNYAANKLGYSKNITNITFSQTGALDHLNPQKISSELSHRWLFKSFDDARFMTEYSKTIDYLIPMNILGYLHANSMMKLLNKNSFGILHTGILGDIVVGTYSSEDFHREWKILDGAKSSIKVHILTELNINFNYQNEEIFKFYNSGLNGVRAFEEVLQSEIEQYSPFLDIDFLNYSIKLPLSLRRHHKLYFNWINSYYPSAAKFKWTGNSSKINSLQLKILGRIVPIDQVPKRILNKIKFMMGYSTNSKSDMNPFDLYSKVPYVREFIHNNNAYHPLIMELLDESSIHSMKTYDLFNLHTLNALITVFEEFIANE